MSLKTDSLIIGFTGPVFSGCSKIAKMLCKEKEFEKYKFKRYSLSETLQKKYFEIKGGKPDSNNRAELQDFGNELRKEDSAILVKETLKQIDNEKVENNIIIDSIRNNFEVFELRKYSNFFLIAVNASSDVRFERASEMNKALTKSKFKQDDHRDSGVDEPSYGQKVQNCVDLADFVLINTNDIAERVDNYNDLVLRIQLFLKLIENPGFRYPNSAEIGMNYAYCASTLSRCMQRSVGAVITKPIKKNAREEQIISIGCNNVPNGVKDCKEAYGICYRKKVRERYFKDLAICPVCKESLDIKWDHDCGCKKDIMENHYFPYKILDYCQALHAEESAILQALHSTASGLEDTILYTSTFPCLLCAKKIIQTGISKIIYSEPYPVKEAVELLKQTIGEKNIIPFEGIKSLAFYRLFRHN